MRILLFGAGASLKAGYPRAANLIDEIEKEARDSTITNLSTAWAEWQHLRDGSSGLAGYLLRNSNPEVVLSLQDLCEVARESEDKEAFAKARDAIKAGSNPADLWNHLKSEGRDLATQAIAARDRFRDCLNWYFLYKHQLDSKPENKCARDCLRRVLSRLVAGDKVLTLNWDTTAERTLLEDERWNPMGGYGFRKILFTGCPDSSPKSLDFEIPESEIVVLKLHGSVGWHQTREGRFYFEERYGFLRDFNFRHEGTVVSLTDPEPAPIGPPEGFLLGYPSFLKQVRGQEMQLIWDLASIALDVSESVEIWGYSLPQSDTAIRTLLNHLRFRLANREVRVRVHEGVAEVRDRWREFLGEAAEVDAQLLE
jgi:hypothetical protein